MAKYLLAWEQRSGNLSWAKLVAKGEKDKDIFTEKLICFIRRNENSAAYTITDGTVPTLKQTVLFERLLEVQHQNIYLVKKICFKENHILVMLYKRWVNDHHTPILSKAIKDILIESNIE